MTNLQYCKDLKIGGVVTNLRILDAMKEKGLIKDYNKFGDVEFNSSPFVNYMGCTFAPHYEAGVSVAKIKKISDTEKHFVRKS